MVIVKQVAIRVRTASAIYGTTFMCRLYMYYICGMCVVYSCTRRLYMVLYGFVPSVAMIPRPGLSRVTSDVHGAP